MATIKSAKALTGCAAGLEITDDFRKAVKYQVEYESGSVRYYDVDKAPKTVLSWIDSHREPEPEETVEPRADEATRHPQPEPEKMELIPVPDTVSPVAVSEPLVQATPETEPDTVSPIMISPLAIVQLTALFIAGVGVYTLWWIVQAFSIIENGFWWILPRARAGAMVVSDALSMVRACAVESFSFREMILTENGSMGRV